MERQDYNRMIAANASVIYAGCLSNGIDTPKDLLENCIKDARLIAKLCGVEPVDEHTGMGNSDYKHPNSHVIDLNKTPFCPDWLKVESHEQGGMWTFNPDEIELFLTDKQKTEWVKGTDIERELKDKKVLNANVLDYLLAHTELIPDSWKDKYVYFWGTIYRCSGGSLYVRSLYWHDGQWNWNSYWLDRKFDAQNPAAVVQVKT